MNGFLGTGATWRADLNLVVQVVMALALLAGMGLARRGRFDAHGYCQSSVMLLNLRVWAQEHHGRGWHHRRVGD